ncbi:GntR family transcriptional regulator [Arthrobacter sp. MYb229]|uniref:GntR family transcriptional regulator n=1 Tax=unclassified Arthrobacter TaxID=235627 RepID=UPI000CFAEC1E|nr:MULTISPECIES: GntR family transcriptional regulator [unclassified Arthrobacter]PRA06912.1 GntR family transcriptional regulator [Arthrobacter sp. MYb229]PRB47860.1 GntR family transcriptional regulator [Arthrobacter sp. MYb216]
MKVILANAIKRDSPVAVYAQLAVQLGDELDGMSPGDRFRTEEDIIKESGLSRTTVRRAVQQLVEQGLLIRRQGKGTFVLGNRPVQSVTKLAPFVESFTAAGICPSVSLQAFAWLDSKEEVPERIRELSDSFLLARRIYSADGLRVAVAEIYLPWNIGAEVTIADLQNHPVYQVLQEQVGKTFKTAQLQVTLVPPREEIRVLLDVSELTYVPRLQRMTFSDTGEFLECTVTHFLPEAFELQAEVATEIPQNISYTFSRSDK